MAASKRIFEINPYNPYPTEALGAAVTTGIPEFSQNDIGKPVKISGDSNVLCASGDEVYGFIVSVSVATVGGVGTGSLANRKGQMASAIDEAGSLVPGNFVVAGTAFALGTNPTTTGGNSNVIAGIPTAASINRWVVKSVSAAAAGATVVLECI